MSESNQFEMPAPSPTPETPPTPAPSTAPVAMVVAPMPPQRTAASQQALWRARGLAAGGPLVFTVAASAPLVAGAGPGGGVGGRQPGAPLFPARPLTAPPPASRVFGGRRG